MANVNLPEGMSPQAIMSALQFLAQQAQANAYQRPSGVLPASMIRGVNKNYVYEFKPYPKCLNPPDVEVASAKEERALRLKWKTPLPWMENDPQGKEYISEYYARREYPVRMTPPQILVHDEEQENAIKAGWRAEYGEDAVLLYPAWFFHPSMPPALVNSAKEREKLGPGWYKTVAEAVDAAKGIKPAVRAADELDRDKWMKAAEGLDIKVDARMKTERIRGMVEEARAKIAEQVI